MPNPTSRRVGCARPRRDATVFGCDQLNRAPVAAADLTAVNRNVHPVAGLPVLFRTFQRQQNGERRRRAGVVARVMAGHLDRLAVGRPGRVQGTANRLHRDLRAAVQAVGTGLAVGRDRAHDQLRVDGVQRLPAPARILGFARAQVLDHHIHDLRQSPHGGRAVVGVRIEHDRLLARVQVQVQSGGFDVLIVTDKRAELPRRIAAARLRLDHTRAVIGQQLCGVRTGDLGGQVQDDEPLQRSGHTTPQERAPTRARPASGCGHAKPRRQSGSCTAAAVGSAGRCRTIRHVCETGWGLMSERVATILGLALQRESMQRGSKETRP